MEEEGTEYYTRVDAFRLYTHFTIVLNSCTDLFDLSRVQRFVYKQREWRTERARGIGAKFERAERAATERAGMKVFEGQAFFLFLFSS